MQNPVSESRYYMINKEELIKYLEEQMKIYWEEPFGGIYTAEEAVELIKLFPEIKE